ncbi:MAG: beta-ketoacyl-ACP synthase III [Actinomycetota bacterium]
MTRASRILSVGSALPDQVVGNDAFPDSSDEWVRTRTGIHERHFASDGETASTLAIAAARPALEAAGVDPAAVDLVIVATVSGDQPLPTTAAYVQKELGTSGGGFDLGAACAGFVYGLTVADTMVTAGASDMALVIGTEVLSRFINIEDRSTAVLFGDGAGAALVGASDEPGIITSLLELDGRYSETLTIPGGGSARPATAETVASKQHTIHMPDGGEIFRRAVIAMAESCQRVLDKAGYSADDVTLLIPHQANARIIKGVAKRLGFPMERVVLDIETVGNTSAASVPIALDHAWRAGRLSPGDLILTVAFGGGLTWGANLVRWTAETPR